MTTGERIKSRRVQLGLSVDELAARLGKNRATVYRYENNDITNFPAKVLEPLAKVLATTPAALMGWSKELTAAPAVCAGDPIPSLVPAPRLGTIHSGVPILDQENIECYDLVPDWARCDFTLRCKDDSMIGARIFDGDLVCIHAQSQVEHGEIAAVLVDREAVLKRVCLYPDHIILQPENPNHRPLVFWDTEMDQVKILGKATYFISAVR